MSDAGVFRQPSVVAIGAARGTPSGPSEAVTVPDPMPLARLGRTPA